MDANKTKEDNDIKIEHFDCECASPEHTLRFCYFKPEIDEYPELYTEIYLNKYRNIFSRVWVAIKYIFGYTSKYGHWDTWILRRKDCERLRDLTTRIIEFDKAKEKITKKPKLSKKS